MNRANQIRGKIFTIRATVKKLNEIEAAKHTQLQKELLKASVIDYQFQKMQKEMQGDHPVLSLVPSLW